MEGNKQTRAQDTTGQSQTTSHKEMHRTTRNSIPLSDNNPYRIDTSRVEERGGATQKHNTRGVNITHSEECLNYTHINPISDE